MNVDFFGRVSLGLEDFLLVTKFAENEGPWVEMKVRVNKHFLDSNAKTGAWRKKRGILSSQSCGCFDRRKLERH